MNDDYSVQYPYQMGEVRYKRGQIRREDIKEIIVRIYEHQISEMKILIFQKIKRSTGMFHPMYVDITHIFGIKPHKILKQLLEIKLLKIKVK